MEETLRRVYLQGTSEQRERLGVCGNCGRRGHTASNCPRPKAVAAPQQGQQAHEALYKTFSDEGSRKRAT